MLAEESLKLPADTLNPSPGRLAWRYLRIYMQFAILTHRNLKKTNF